MFDDKTPFPIEIFTKIDKQIAHIRFNESGRRKQRRYCDETA